MINLINSYKAVNKGRNNHSNITFTAKPMPKDIANEIKDGIQIIPVKTIFEALAHVFAEKAPAKKPRATKQATPKKK